MAFNERLTQLNVGASIFGVTVDELIHTGKNSTIHKVKASNGAVYLLKITDRHDNYPPIQHPNIGNIIRRHQDKNIIYSLTGPVVDSLYNRFISKQGERCAVVDDINEQMNIKAIFSQIFDVLLCLHTHNIYQYTITPQSIFYTIRADNTLEVKLFDFDYAVIVHIGGWTPLVMLPNDELQACIHNQQQPSILEKADVWSLGISLYQILMNQAQLLNGGWTIVKEVFNIDSAFQQNYTPVFLEFMQGVLHPDVEQRWSLVKAYDAFTLIQNFWLPRVTEDEKECGSDCDI
ncbi:kinase-like domain-containing protein, partial [Jimgerdemannia flammicorona]